MNKIALMLIGLAVSPSFAGNGELRMPSENEISSLIVPVATPAPVQAAGSDVIVTVDRFATQNNAPVVFTICDSAKCHELQDQGYKDVQAVLLESGPASRKYKISGMKPGEYSLSGFNDLNNNKVLDKGFFGIPKEPVGFSKLNVEKISSYPSWGDVRFTVTATGAQVVFHLVNRFGL